MKIVFVSNYMNHHQLRISQEFCKRCEFVFVACESIEQERIDMGYKDMNKEYDFILRSYENNEQYLLAEQKIYDADVVIFGSGDFELIKRRITNNKLTFRYSERLFKNYKLLRMFYPPYIKKIWSQCSRYKNNKYFLLCSSAFSKKDYNWFGAFKDKAFKWGYFPYIESFDDKLEEICENKSKENLILWCGRFIKFKHPEYAIDCAKYLKKHDINFKIKMVGTGVLLQKIKRKIQKNNLSKYIEIVGALPFDKVQHEMKQAKIFLFTSNQSEGWGAVLNESMGNACCVIANKNIGSVPFMVQNKENGFTYSNKQQFLQTVLHCCENDMKDISKKAYYTVHKVWNAENAVNNFIKLVEKIEKSGDGKTEIDGPCEKF